MNPQTSNFGGLIMQLNDYYFVIRDHVISLVIWSNFLWIRDWTQERKKKRSKKGKISLSGHISSPIQKMHFLHFGNMNKIWMNTEYYNTAQQFK